MGRNTKLRYMAEQLPPFPKLKTTMMEMIDGDSPPMRVKKKAIQRDSAGNIIYVNHFKELKVIEQKMIDAGVNKNDPRIAKAFVKYQQMVMAYDKRSKEKGVWDKAALAILLALLAYAVYYIQKELGIKII